MQITKYSAFLAIFIVLMFCFTGISRSIGAKLIARWPMDESSGERDRCIRDRTRIFTP